MALSTKLKKTINTGLRILIAVLALLFIYRQINQTEHIISFIDSVVSGWSHCEFLLPVIIAIILMPVNWGIEAFKWQQLINYAERVTYSQAMKSVFTGITVSLFTPNRIGEFFGRLMTLRKAPPLKGAFLTITGSISQLITTLLFGMLALCIFLPLYYPAQATGYLFIYMLIVFTSVIAGTAIVMMYLRVSTAYRLTTAFVRPGWEKIRGYLRVIRRLKRKLLFKVLLLSMARYLVFSTQFYLLLLAFGLSIDWFNAYILVSMTYFAMTAIPTIALVDLGIRGSVSLYFLGLYFHNDPLAAVSILAASTSVWIINLAIPSLLGLLFINRIRLIRKES